ncbi:sigma-54 dependent DNA-binding response regulator [Desulforapulum autotrophicum HRM2]|uniref:Sigma-54 dependent DNA-binding response regulator n=1 Tax=Desulforapulum autotrophicum (strain ATCC 43914 / DSM 3382 / VKM B-1955 / HRM2) TaxID=177437 RepID=C0Q938_DESAH|nr:sigma 54-interacting transcriptional regulator [Desulforapulum autotrophicum]ACN16543.1 sigma-54 dependent DNA-binding response regulator [Desulforapulum autotrophicum HRM2]
MKIDENDFFRQTALRISSSLDINKAMRNCMNYLKQHIPASGMYFVVYEPGLNIINILASIMPKKIQGSARRISIPAEYQDDLKKRFSEESQIKIINDLNDEPEPLQKIVNLVFPFECSLLEMHLKLDGTRIGLFGVLSEGKHRYSEFHSHLITLVHEPFAVAISNILQHQEIQRLNKILSDDNRYLHREMMHLTGDTIIGSKFGLKDVMRMVEHVAPTDSPVMIMGETGTGKEVIANAIHLSSRRKDSAFIKINCGAIPDNLIDSELFGHEKGAFTGAVSRKRGRFERAHNGTIFLDEVGELPLQAQVRLLRVLQQHEIERVGGSETIPVDVRIVAATHKNLEEMVRTGQFRADLWFRLNVFPIHIPPLRHRTIDLPALTDYFLEKKSMELKIRKRPSLAPGTMEKMQAYEWPGNVRELQNLVERALIFNQMKNDESQLTFDPQLINPIPKENMTLKREDGKIIRPLDEVMANHIQKVLDQTNGKVEGKNGAASLLKINPGTLRGRMKKLKIDYGRKFNKKNMNN